MKSILRSLVAMLFLGVLAIANMASRMSSPVFQTITPTPTDTLVPVSSTSQVGTTNGIALLGILIFAVIVISIAIHLRELRTVEQ